MMEPLLVVLFAAAIVVSLATVATLVFAGRDRASVAAIADRVTTLELGFSVVVAAVSYLVGVTVIADEGASVSDGVLAAMVFGIGGACVMYLARALHRGDAVAGYEWAAVLFAAAGALAYGAVGLPT